MRHPQRIDPLLRLLGAAFSQHHAPGGMLLQQACSAAPWSSTGGPGPNVQQQQQGPGGSTRWGPCLTLAAGYAKGRGHHASQQEGPKGESGDAEFDAKEAVSTAEGAMRRALEHFKQELTNIRGGRANPGLLEPIMVEVEGERTQLRNFGTVTQRNPHLLVVNVFNQKDRAAVMTAVRESPLELQARVEGKEVHVPVPRPTVEMLQRMAKLVHQEAEAAKNAVRKGRQAAMDVVKKAVKTKDERFRLEKEVQKLCDRFVAEIEQIKLAKDKDLKENS